MNYKVLTLNKISKKGLKLLPDNFEVGDNIENPDAILVRSANLHDMDIPRSVKFIGRAGAGVNNIPLEKCAESGIVVCNTPGANANAVKEIVAAGLLMSSRKLTQGVDWAKGLKDGDADVAKAVEKGKSQFAGPELAGKKLGIVGLGAVGVLVANMAVDLGMRVYGYDPYISIENAWGLSRKVKRAKSLEGVFSNCDYVTLHLPYMEETKNTVNAELLSQAKGIRLLNFARGGLVDNAALKDALEDGRVAAYVTDFPSEETLDLPNTINIPHLGASTPESEENCAVMAVQEMIDYLTEGNIIHSVNYPDVDMGRMDNVGRITICHHNVPNMIAQVTTILGNDNINISDMTNKNRGNFAYTMIDVDSPIVQKVKDDLYKIKGVTRVRILK
ncbi:MAG: phosphoglycerate dehydrogenase [Eubacteriaceae bacterium]|jgi:D-3-phosphoglycerate dehydrogenase